MNFDEMNAVQRRLHNAACVMRAEGDEHGFEKLQCDAIDEIQQLLTMLREARDTIDALPGYPRGAELCDRIDAICGY